MTDVVQSGRWAPGMASPNPSGRPKGIVDKRQKLQSAFAEDGVAIVKVVIGKALEGDMQAANIALARIAPPIKAQAERVQFELSSDVSLSEQARQILAAVAQGKVDAETGRVLIGCIQSVAGIKAIEELEQRIITLEEKAA
jgi:Family of unknown function (DUF5681)